MSQGTDGGSGLSLFPGLVYVACNLRACMLIDWWKCLQECDLIVPVYVLILCFLVSIRSMMNDSCSILYHLVVQWFSELIGLSIQTDFGCFQF